MILARKLTHRHVPADVCRSPEFGFASKGLHGHDDQAERRLNRKGLRDALRSIPSLTPRSGLRAGSPRGLGFAAADRRAHRQAFAHRQLSAITSVRIRLASVGVGVGFRSTTTVNGGSISCVNPTFFWPFWPQRLSRPVCKPMASVRLPVRRAVRSWPMRSTPTSSLAPLWARWLAPIATTQAFANKAERAVSLTRAAARASFGLTDTIGASRPGGVFIFTDHNELTDQGRGARMAAATEGKGLTCSRKS